MSKIAKFKELSFLVYGLGLSGRSVINFFKKKKIEQFYVWDDNKKSSFKRYRPKNLRQSLHKVDYIILAPGVSLIKNKQLKKFQKKIITDIDLFYLFNKNFKSIVVTGTNGKSTTCKLIAHLLRKSKLKYTIGGNIGTPILDIKISKNIYVIIEASSFQLSHSQFIKPDYAFFLNLTNDHLDWHGNMNHYLNSKLKIFNLQQKSHFAIINLKLKKIFFKRKFLGKPIFPKIKNYEKIKDKIKNDYLISKINNENMSFVYEFAKILKIKEKSFINIMGSFKGLTHRFEIFLKKKGVIFINDSKATSFAAMQPALQSLDNIYLILGGLPKKNDKINLSRFNKKIKKCYLIGKRTNFFKKQISQQVDFITTKNIKNSIIQIFKDISLDKKQNKVILLSPAAASFDQFQNFEKRGDEFKKWCEIYARKFI